MAKRDPTADALRELRALERDPGRPDAEAILKRALANRANVVVGRAAPLVASLGLRSLAPDLEKAFEFFRETPDRDRESATKIAIVHALSRLGEDLGEETLLAAIYHSQFEYGSVTGLHGEEMPIDGGAALRGTAIIALAEREHPQAANEAIRLLTKDPYVQARKGALAALTAMHIPNLHLILRIKALQNDDFPDVISETYKALAVVDPDGIEFVSQFLTGHGAHNALLAALALSDTARLELVEPLIETWKHWRDQDEMLNEYLLVAIAGIRHEKSFEFLLDTVRDGNASYGEWALYALQLYNDDPDARAQIREAAAESTNSSLIALANRMFRDR